MKKILTLMICLVMGLSLCSCVTNGTDPVIDPNKPVVDPEEPKLQTLVEAVNLPDSMVAFEANRSVKTNKRTEFYDLTKNYLVGDDNSWVAKPKVSFVTFDPETEAIEPTSVSEWSYQIKVYIKNGQNYELIQNDNKTYIDAVDLVKCTVDFAAGAVTNSFKVEVYPDKLTARQQENIANYTVSYEFDVIDGHNVYDAKDLAYMENRNFDNNEQKAWAAYKEEENIDPTYLPKALILQDDIIILPDDMPSYFFYQEGEISKFDSDYQRALGSMKDNNDMFVRILSENETFSIQGNYFKIDNSNLKEVTRENGEISEEGTVISHTTLFRFEGAASAYVTMENINIVGNAPRVENNIKAGGEILVKVQGPKFLAKNNITICTFITYMPNYTDAEFVVDSCKVYDAFNCFIYNWGSPLVYIKNSEMIGAGGPGIIQDHVDATAANGGRPSTTMIENTKIESFVAGSEGWFSVVKASTAVGSIKGLDALFSPFGRSIIKKSEDGSITYMNLICVNKSGSAESLTAEKVKGNLTIDGVAFDYGVTANPYLAGLLENTFVNGAPAFQTSAAELNNGIGYTDGATGIFDITNTQIVNPANAMYNGDTIAIYYQGMMLVLGYYTVGQIYVAE